MWVTVCIALHVFLSVRENEVDTEHVRLYQFFTSAQMSTDVCMAIAYSLVALECVDQVFIMLASSESDSENLYNRTVGTPVEEEQNKKGFLQFLMRMPHKGTLLSLFILLCGAVVVILVFIVPAESMTVVVMTGHLIMSTLVLIAYLTLFVVAIVFSRILKKVDQVIAQMLRRRIVGLCLTASIVGILRYPFDVTVAIGSFTIADSPGWFIATALFMRYVPCTLVCILMWPLPNVSKISSTAEGSPSTSSTSSSF